MPATRSCRDLSVLDNQKKIDFPCRKTRSNTINISGNVAQQKDLTKKLTNRRVTRKRPIIQNDENSSPYKSPRKSPSPWKAPLSDRRNLDSPTLINVAKRQLTLDDEDLSTKLRQALHTSIPNVLISREREQSFVLSFMKKALVEMKPASLYMSGAPGTGKTACLMKVMEEMKCSDCKKFQQVFINCMSIKTSQNIYIKLANEFGKGGLSSKDAFKFLEKKFTSHGPKMLLVLDEIDQLESKSQDVLYKLFEMPFLPKSRLVLIGIANALDLTDRILPRLQSKASCKPLLLQFSPYSKDEICSILNARVNEINPNAIDPAAVQFCARKVCAITGDVRKALDILRRSIELKETKEKGSPASVTSVSKVTIAHVASVCSDVYGTRLSSNSGATTFPLQQKLVICTLMVCLKDKKIKEVTVGKLYEAYSRVCKSRQVTSVAQEEFSGLCNLLEAQGILSVKKTKDSRNDKVALRLEESEVEHSLQDRLLITSIFSTGIPPNP